MLSLVCRGTRLCIGENPKAEEKQPISRMATLSKGKEVFRRIFYVDADPIIAEPFLIPFTRDTEPPREVAFELSFPQIRGLQDIPNSTDEYT